MLRAFESLLAENYTNFVLTVGFTAVAIYCNGNVGFKIFDSHARDSYGRSHAQGTCVLLEVLSLSDLVHYFQSIHNNVMFEVKGLIINEAENDILVQTCVCETMKFKLSTTVAIYSSRKRILLEKKQAKDSTNKKELQKKRAQKYKTMDAFKKQRPLDKHAEKYKTMLLRSCFSFW